MINTSKGVVTIFSNTISPSILYQYYMCPPSLSLQAPGHVHNSNAGIWSINGLLKGPSILLRCFSSPTSSDRPSFSNWTIVWLEKPTSKRQLARFALNPRPQRSNDHSPLALAHRQRCRFGLAVYQCSSDYGLKII